MHEEFKKLAAIQIAHEKLKAQKQRNAAYLLERLKEMRNAQPLGARSNWHAEFQMFEYKFDLCLDAVIAALEVQTKDNQ